MYSPNGKKDGIQIIPPSEIAAKDAFLNIKNVSRDDMMAAHRVPPQMMGIMPSNFWGFGDVEKAEKVFVKNELILLQKKFRIFKPMDWGGYYSFWTIRVKLKLLPDKYFLAAKVII